MSNQQLIDCGARHDTKLSKHSSIRAEPKLSHTCSGMEWLGAGGNGEANH